MEMTEQRAREILGQAIVADGGLYSDDCYNWSDDEPKYLFVERMVALTADELEAIAFWMRKHAP